MRLQQLDRFDCVLERKRRLRRAAAARPRRAVSREAGQKRGSRAAAAAGMRQQRRACGGAAERRHALLNGHTGSAATRTALQATLPFALADPAPVRGILLRLSEAAARLSGCDTGAQECQHQKQPAGAEWQQARAQCRAARRTLWVSAAGFAAVAATPDPPWPAMTSLLLPLWLPWWLADPTDALGALCIASACATAAAAAAGGLRSALAAMAVRWCSASTVRGVPWSRTRRASGSAAILRVRAQAVRRCTKYGMQHSG